MVIRVVVMVGHGHPISSLVVMWWSVEHCGGHLVVSLKMWWSLGGQIGQALVIWWSGISMTGQLVVVFFLFGNVPSRIQLIT